jgi:hypothetical protein
MILLRLLKSTKLLQDESLVSLIYRLAKINYYDSPAVFKNVLDVKKRKINGNDFSYEDTKKVSDLINGDVNDLYKRSIDYHRTNDREIDELLFLRSRVKFCPFCIKDEPYHKWVWNINPIAICLNHSILLIDKCENCNKNISLRSLMKKTCLSCGFEFVNTKTESIETKSFLFLSQMDLYNRLIGGDVDILPYMPFHEYIYLAKKILFLFEDQKSFIPPTNETINSFTRKSGDFFDNKKSLIAFANVFWMFKNFPVNFFKVLDGFEKIDYSLRKRRKKQFEEILLKEKFLFLKEAYIKYKDQQIIEGNTSSNIAAYDKEGALKKKERFYTKKDVLKVLGIPRGQLDNLIRNRKLKPKEVHRGKRVHFLFERADILKIAHELKEQQDDLITRMEAAKIMGIHCERIKNLIDANLLNLKTSPLVNGTFLSKQEVKDLINSRNLIYKECQSSEWINFSKVFDKYATSGVSIQKLLLFIREGKLNPITTKKNPKLTDFFFHENEIKKILHEIKMKARNQEG